MSENTITTFSQTPYVDDFHSTDPLTGKTPEEKNYLRILYKPGVSVQARELNQMQSIVQSQIDKFGRGVFSEGASIIEGEKNFDDDIYAVDVTFNTAPGSSIDELTMIQNNDGLKASIIETFQLSEDDLQHRLFIRYENSTQNAEIENVKEFSTEAIDSTYDVTTWATAGSNIGAINTIQYAALATIEPGVFFVKGEFVLSEAQDIYMIKPSADYLISGKVSFEINETVMTSGDDPTLLDNAAGTPNYAAPGADRYAIDLSLLFISDYDGDPNGEDNTFITSNSSVISSDVADDSNKSYSPIITIVNNNIQEKTQTLFSDNLEATLARRTSEESGNYALKPFVIDIRDFLNDTSDIENRGLYTTDQIKTFGIEVEKGDISGIAPNATITIDSNTPDNTVEQYGKSRFIVGLEPSIAYVEGFRIDPETRIDIPVERARTTEDDVEVYTTARLGNYLEGTSITGLPTFGETVNFNVGNATAKVRGLEYVGGNYRLYLYDISEAISNGANAVNAAGSGFSFDFVAGSGLKDTEYTQSIYQLPYDDISDVDTVEFTVRDTKGSVVSNGNQIEISDINVRFFDENENSYIVVDSDGTTVEIVSAVLGGVNNNTVTLTINENSSNQYSNGDSVTVLLSYKKTLSPKSKTSQTGIKIITNLDENFQDLDHKDVYKIESATYIPAVGEDPVDITNDIVLDDGQRDSVYKTSSIRYNGSLNLGSAEITVNYKYFARGTGDYYNRNSYAIDYEDIPSYGETSLSDVLDFRPDDDSYNTATIDPNSVIEATISFYLGRIDKVVVNNVGDFNVINGTPSSDPVEPETPDSSMLLYTIDVPPYTSDVRDIEASYVDNRRYTMRDIGEIENRVKNLEYYTSLSLLEREATGKQIFDTTTGTPYDRFKNGILVDSFLGHSVGDVFDDGYLCSIDKEEGVLRPAFDQSSTRFRLNDDINSYGSLATLDYVAEIPFIDQQRASTHMSVNPYAVAAWWGEVKLSPSSDEWKETSQRPDIVVNKENDASVLKAISDASKAQGTVWNSWRTNWTGRPSRGDRSRRWGRRCNNIRRRGWCRNHGGNRWGTSSRQSRDGIRTTMSIETVRNVVNEKVVDTSIVPFIRSRRVYFQGKMFRPNTKLYVYFDDVDISSYATKAAFQEFKSSTDVQSFLNKEPNQIFSGSSRQEIITDDNGNIEGYFVIPNNAAHKFRTGEREVVFTDNEANDETQATTTATATYSASGVMEHMQKTVVSTRRVRLTRERVRQRRNLLRWNRWNIAARNRRLFWSRRRNFWSRRRWRDPLAQSFMIGEIETGLYATSLDLYFYKKSANVPVQMYLVTMDNGYPTQEVIPFSEVTLLPDQVNISDDASLKTNFKFESPVYLQAGVEYAIVVLSNDDAYRMWLSEIGKDDVNTGDFIAKNTYTGVMFKSQNASTWTADQNKDFKFTFYRAQYEENVQKELIFSTVGISGAADDNSDGPLEYSQLSVISESVSIPQTSLNYQLSTDGGDSYYDIEIAEDIYRSTANTPITDDNTIKLKAILSSDSEYITPVVDLDRISLIGVKNFVNSENDLLTDTSDPTTDTELNSIHGNAVARYITHEVELNNPADQLNVYLNIHRPIEQSNVKVYARFKTGEESIKNLPFDELPPETVIPISSTRESYNEVLFSINKEPSNFTSFQVKIVMVSDTHADVPVIKDFRAIATT